MNASKKRYKHLKAMNRCVIYTATASGAVLCLSCAAKAKRRYERRRAAGMCHSCGKRPYSTVHDRRFSASASIGNIPKRVANRQIHHCDQCRERVRFRALKAYYARRPDLARGAERDAVTRGTVGF